jgi:hypothetical protein
LLGIRAHDQARKPADDAAYDQPDDETHVPSLLFTAANSLGDLEHRKTRDAGLLFRIRNQVSSLGLAESRTYPQKTAGR